MVVYIFCFEYSLVAVVVAVAVVVSFPLLSYLTVFISAHEFYRLSIYPPHPAGVGEGKQRGEQVAVYFLFAGC